MPQKGRDGDNVPFLSIIIYKIYVEETKKHQSTPSACGDSIL